nr:MAG TPA: hypothetical protein [Caudoviricetes sp.]
MGESCAKREKAPRPGKSRIVLIPITFWKHLLATT